MNATKPIIVELASYPKCGNTWLRYLLSKQFNLNIHTDIPDFHQRHDKTEELIKYVTIGKTEYGFYKSHIPNIKSINPDKILLIYRHPLDVFLSCLNYFYINTWTNKFLNGELKSVEDLKDDGKLSIYFEKFTKNLGSDYYPELLGSLSNYFSYLESATKMYNVIPIKYEELYDLRELSFSSLLTTLTGTDVRLIDNLFISVDDNTKLSGNKFFWKATKNNYKSFLTDAQIHQFHDKYKMEMKEYGYQL